MITSSSRTTFHDISDAKIMKIKVIFTEVFRHTLRTSVRVSAKSRQAIFELIKIQQHVRIHISRGLSKILLAMHCLGARLSPSDTVIGAIFPRHGISAKTAEQLSTIAQKATDRHRRTLKVRLCVHCGNCRRHNNNNERFQCSVHCFLTSEPWGWGNIFVYAWSTNFVLSEVGYSRNPPAMLRLHNSLRIQTALINIQVSKNHNKDKTRTVESACEAFLL